MTCPGILIMSIYRARVLRFPDKIKPVTIYLRGGAAFNKFYHYLKSSTNFEKMPAKQHQSVNFKDQMFLRPTITFTTENNCKQPFCKQLWICDPLNNNKMGKLFLLLFTPSNKSLTESTKKKVKSLWVQEIFLNLNQNSVTQVFC